MLFSCPECNGKVSSLTLFCPHCGFPISEENDLKRGVSIPEHHTCSYFTINEQRLIIKIEKIGKTYGSSHELKDAIDEAYSLYKKGKISSVCYGKIYSDAFDNYLGRL